MSKKSKQDWHRADVIASLHKMGKSLADIARDQNYADLGTPGKVFRQPWPLMEGIIAGIIGKAPQAIWPSRYNADGSHKGRGIRRKRSTAPAAANSKLQRSAETVADRPHRNCMEPTLSQFPRFMEDRAIPRRGTGRFSPPVFLNGEWMTEDARQLNLLNLLNAPAPVPDAPGTLDCADAVRGLVNGMVKASPLSRVQIAEQMSRLTGCRITVEMLNTWTAKSRKQHRFPLEFSPALERVTGSHDLTEFLAALAGGEAYFGPDVAKARLGLLQMERAKIDGAIRHIKNEPQVS